MRLQDVELLRVDVESIRRTRGQNERSRKSGGAQRTTAVLLEGFFSLLFRCSSSPDPGCGHAVEFELLVPGLCTKPESVRRLRSREPNAWVYNVIGLKVGVPLFEGAEMTLTLRRREKLIRYAHLATPGAHLPDPTLEREAGRALFSIVPAIQTVGSYFVAGGANQIAILAIGVRSVTESLGLKDSTTTRQGSLFDLVSPVEVSAKPERFATRVPHIRVQFFVAGATRSLPLSLIHVVLGWIPGAAGPAFDEPERFPEG